MSARVLAHDATSGRPAVVGTGSLAFTATAGVGRAPDSVRAACDGAYGQISEWLAAAGCGSVARLDHFTTSQSWLADRQASRAEHFGRPAPLASTGIAAIGDPADLLHVAAIAASGRSDVEVLIEGAEFAMPHIATAVRLASTIFVSGLLGDPADGDRQVIAVCDALEQIIERCADGSGGLRRLDCYCASEEVVAALDAEIGERWGAAPRLHTVAPFAAGELLEITALLGVGDGDVNTTSQIGFSTTALGPRDRHGAVAAAMAQLRTAARRAGIGDDGWARLDVASSDDRDVELLHQLLAPLRSVPVVVSRRSMPLAGSTTRIALIGV